MDNTYDLIGQLDLPDSILEVYASMFLLYNAAMNTIRRTINKEAPAHTNMCLVVYLKPSHPDRKHTYNRWVVKFMDDPFYGLNTYTYHMPHIIITYRQVMADDITWGAYIDIIGDIEGTWLFDLARSLDNIYSIAYGVSERLCIYILNEFHDQSMDGEESNGSDADASYEYTDDDVEGSVDECNVGDISEDFFMISMDGVEYALFDYITTMRRPDTHIQYEEVLCSQLSGIQLDDNAHTISKNVRASNGGGLIFPYPQYTTNQAKSYEYTVKPIINQDMRRFLDVVSKGPYHHTCLAYRQSFKHARKDLKKTIISNFTMTPETTPCLNCIFFKTKGNTNMAPYITTCFCNTPSPTPPEHYTGKVILLTNKSNYPIIQNATKKQKQTRVDTGRCGESTTSSSLFTHHTRTYTRKMCKNKLLLNDGRYCNNHNDKTSIVISRRKEYKGNGIMHIFDNTVSAYPSHNEIDDDDMITLAKTRIKLFDYIKMMDLHR